MERPPTPERPDPNQPIGQYYPSVFRRIVSTMQGEESVEASVRRLHQRANAVHCLECNCSSGLKWSGWLAYRVDDLETGSLPELGFYCPTCAEREFGYGAV